MTKHNNIIIGKIGFSLCHDVERAINTMLERGLTPTHFFFGRAMDDKNEQYIIDFCKEKSIFLRFRWNKSINKDQFMLLGRKFDEN